MLRVQYYRRKAGPAHFSLERVFEAVRKALPADILPGTHSCLFQSRRILKRIVNVVDASFHQHDINHIEGDVHYLTLGLKKRKTILTIHDCVILQFSTGLAHAFFLWFWFKLPIRRVAAITVISQFTRDEIVRYTGCDPGIMRVIPDPVPNGFLPFPKEFREELPVILQVGTAPHNKNLCRVAEALQGIPCQLEIIGQISNDQRAVLEANSIDFVAQWGLSDEQMIEKYRECDIVVFASTYEGFGMPIVEANSIGRPVITSNIRPMLEVAGRAACLVDPFDASSIRKGVLRVINDPNYRKQLVELGFENAKRFQIEQIAAEYADLYRQVASATL
jgi:glycosyltransferase involved in cell wall biosynthesis